MRRFGLDGHLFTIVLFVYRSAVEHALPRGADMMFFKSLTAALMLSFAILAAPAAADDGKLQGFAQIQTADGRIDIDTYHVVREDGTDLRIGLLSIVVHGKHISVTFDKSEFPTLWTLWQNAQARQSASWQPVGDYVETGTTDVSHLRISAGPGVRFMIESPANGAFTSELPASSFSQFSSALQSAESFVAAGKE